jgi:hypothetical protein
LVDVSSRLSWGEKLYPGQELFWTNAATQNIYMGVRRLDDSTYDTSVKITSSKFDEGGGAGTDLATRYSSGYAHSNKKAVLRYNYGNNKLQWLDVHTDGVETLIAQADDAEDGNAVTISISGSKAQPVTFSRRYYGWAYKHTSSAQAAQSWHNWRLSRPSANTHIRNDTVLEYRLALIPGRYFQWTTSTTEVNHFNGKWKSSNPNTGLGNVEVTNSFWDWGWKTTNTERIQDLLGWTHNTSNSNYDAGSGNPFWQDPDPGTTILRLRYNSDDSMDLYDQTNSAVILTKDVDLGGEAFYLAWATGSGISNLDNLHAGGDLGLGTL